MSDHPLELNTFNIETLARDLLAAGKSVRFRAKGSSMRPFIRTGDLVEVTLVVISKFSPVDPGSQRNPDQPPLFDRFKS